MYRALEALVDVMRVPVNGDPSLAVVRMPDLGNARDIECDVLSEAAPAELLPRSPPPGADGVSILSKRRIGSGGS